MEMNVITAPSPTAFRYWSELKDLSDNLKLELIGLLCSSMVKTAPTPTRGWTKSFAGAWQDDRSTDEIIDDIRSARTKNSFEIAL